MEAKGESIKLTPQQQRVLKLLFKFRFVSAQSLAIVMSIRRASVYEVLEYLVKQELITKVYKSEWRIDRRPAYYYLTKSGVTTVRKIMDVKEPVVHALYKNEDASEEFIQHSLVALGCYNALKPHLPEDSEIFTKAEINRFRQFPKNRPDLYIRTPSGQEAIIIILDDKPPYIIRKRLDEIITHSEDEGWDNDTYPHICFILKDDYSKNSFLYGAHKKLESMGMDEEEIRILATSLKLVKEDAQIVWSDALNPHKPVSLFSID
jgi:Fe2+ or Zn2+ uptake regulation protein